MPPDFVLGEEILLQPVIIRELACRCPAPAAKASPAAIAPTSANREVLADLIMAGPPVRLTRIQ